MRRYSAAIFAIVVSCPCTTYAASVDAEEIDAKTRLIGMATHLANLNNFSYTVRAGFDVLQADGQKLEFLETRQVRVSRPEHVRADFVQSEGMKGSLVFDGKELMLYNASENSCATTATVGTIDDALDILSGKLGMRMPLAMLLSAKLPEVLRAKVSAADVVGTCTLDGATCIQLAARGEQVDLQVWIEEGTQPLPRRVVMTYKKEEGMPQYRADLIDLEIRPERDLSGFTVVLPPDADRLQFHTVPAPGSRKAER